MAAINKFVIKLFMDGVQGGWSEVYIAKGETVTAAKDNATALINARKAMMSNELTIIYASVSDLGVLRDSYLALDGIEAGDMTPTTAKPNRDGDAFLVRMETADGKHAERYLRGVPDACIIDAVYDDSGVGGVYETALAAFLIALKDNTMHLNKVDPALPSTWTLSAWTNTFRRGITYRKTGRPFGALRGRRPPA